MLSYECNDFMGHRMSRYCVSIYRLGKLCGLVFLSIVLLCPVLSAQPSGRLLDLRSYGFDIPPGRVSPASDDLVTTLDEQGRTVVARVQVDVGTYHLVMLPNGQLDVRGGRAGH